MTFRSPVTLAREPAGKECRNLAGEIGRRSGSAVRKPFEAREIALLEVRRFDQLPGHGRYAGHGRDALALHQLQRFFRMPLVHEYDLRAVRDGGNHGGMTTRHVEERDR